MRGVDLVDVRIDGEIENLVINGVDVAPLVTAELDRRDPERVKMRPTTPEGFRDAWDIVEGLWDGTVARARGVDPTLLHESVDGEWSFIETLRHSGVRHRRVGAAGDPGRPVAVEPAGPAVGRDGSTRRAIPRDRQARPSLDEVLTLRRDRMATVRGVIDGLTDESLAPHTSRWRGRDGRRRRASRCAGACGSMLNEEW